MVSVYIALSKLEWSSLVVDKYCKTLKFTAQNVRDLVCRIILAPFILAN